MSKEILLCPYGKELLLAEENYIPNFGTYVSKRETYVPKFGMYVS